MTFRWPRSISDTPPSPPTDESQCVTVPRVFVVPTDTVTHPPRNRAERRRRS